MDIEMGVEGSVAELLDLAKSENYSFFNKSEKKTIEKFELMLGNYLRKVLAYKFRDKKNLGEKLSFLRKKMVEHLTGDYELGLGSQTFEELDEIAESLAITWGYCKFDDINSMKEKNLALLGNTIVDGNISLGLIEAKDSKKALINFSNRPKKLKDIFFNAINNIMTINEKIANIIASIAGMNSDKSQELNGNIAGKLLGGLIYEFISGTLISKRHFIPIECSKTMQQLIENEGILHFTSPSNIDKILETGKIKASNFLVSDISKKKAFFFAGVPKFEDLLINIPAYDVMTAIKIMPTKEQMETLKYRALNDRAVVKDGDFSFDRNQVEVVYFGLQYDKENDNIYFNQISKEQAKDFKVCDEVKRAYRYKPKNNSLMDDIKINAYGFFAEYKHHQKLLKFKAEMKKRGIKDFRDVSEKDLFNMTDLQEATIKRSKASVSKDPRVLDFIDMSLKRVTFSGINMAKAAIVRDYERGLVRGEGR